MSIDPPKAPFTDEDMAKITTGEIVPPNLWPEPIDRVVSAMTLANVSASMTSWLRLEEKPHAHKTSARYFFKHGQGGGWHGSGWVVWMDRDESREYVAHAAKFAICEHKSVEDPGANHRRGWHPAHCEKCGLDMTVDSGD